ncbi:MAG: hemerythrin domain-containing protein [Pseudomonadales bacterium]
MATQQKKVTAKKATKKTAIKATRTAAKRSASKVRAGGRAKTKTASVKAKTQSRRKKTSTLANDIMLALHNEHKYIATLQDGLERQTKQLAPGGKPDYRILRDMLHYIAHYPDEFHHPLEDLIYERLVKRHHASTGDVEELLGEHQDMARDTKFLLNQLNAVCDGTHKPMRNQLRQDLQSYVEFYRVHIDLEEGTVFPAAKQHLQESDWQAIDKTINTVKDPLFSGNISSRYKALSDYINDKSGEAVAEFALAELFGIEAMVESLQASFDGLAELREISKRHLRKRVKKNIETLKENRKDGSMSLFSLPGRLISDSIKDTRAVFREIGKLASVTWDGAMDPFAVRADYFKTMMNNKKKDKVR